MKKLWKQLMAGCLIGSLLILSACSGGGSGATPLEAMGRYVEEEFSLPAGVESLMAVGQTDDGALRILTAEEGGGYGFWQSTDNGRNWSRQDTPWLSPLSERIVTQAAIDPDGALYVFFHEDDKSLPAEPGGDSPAGGEGIVREQDGLMETGQAGGPMMRQEGSGEPPALQSSGQGSPGSAIMIGGQPQLARLDADGWREINVEEALKGKMGVLGLKVDGEGQLLVNCANSIERIDPATGQSTATFPASGMIQPGDYFTYDDTLGLYDQNDLRLYSLADGSLQREIKGETPAADTDSMMTIRMGGGSERLFGAGSDSADIYRVDVDGLFRFPEDGQEAEQVIDGAITSLTMPSLQLIDFVGNNDGSFTLFCTSREERSSFILHYFFDPDVASVPTQQLRVFSLRDNKTIRQAIGMFQRQNRDVAVSYTVGIQEEGLTVSDALRTLSNELLAGTGPDVLVLDGLPVDSYIEKGVLYDLSAALDGKLQSGELLDNIAQCYRVDGKLYAIPARFTVPMLDAGDDAIAAIRTFGDMADWLETQPDATIYTTNPETLIRAYYPLMAGGWFQADGTLDEAAFTASLQVLQRLSQLKGFTDSRNQLDARQEAGGDGGDSLMIGAVHIKGGIASLHVGSLRTFQDVMAVYAQLSDRGEGALKPMPDGNGNAVYVPAAVLGVNAGSGDVALAARFVDFALSQEVQTYSFEDGLPVNRTVLEQAITDPNEGEEGTLASLALMIEDPDGNRTTVTLQMGWPPEDFMRALLDSLQKVDTAVPVDTVVQQMVIDETAGFFAGDKSLEDTVKAFRQKIDLYLAE